MAHYAVINSESGIVERVFVGRDEDDLAPGVTDWETYYAVDGTIVRRTSYNTRGGVHYNTKTQLPSDDQSKAFRFNYAGVGYTFDETKGAEGGFIPPKPFDSWVLDETTCLWEAPVPRPANCSGCQWNEEQGDWVEVVEPSA